MVVPKISEAVMKLRCDDWIGRSKAERSKKRDAFFTRQLASMSILLDGHYTYLGSIFLNDFFYNFYLF